MTKKKTQSAVDSGQGLRERAEERLTKTRADVAAMPPGDVQALVHELQVHQVELEMQNDELRRTQAELGQVRDRYLDLYEFVPVGYLTIDRDLAIREANLTASTMFGVQRSALLGMALPDLMFADDRDVCRFHLAHVLSSSERRTFDVNFFRHSQSRFLGRVEASPMEEDGSVATGCRVTITDVTDRANAEQQLHEARQAADAASLAKSRFLANMSHKLRTPMNSILGMTDLALHEALPAAAREYLETARQSSGVLLELLDEVLDVSRIEAGQLELDSAPFSLRSIVDQTIKTMGVRAYQKNVELVCDLPDDLPDQVVGDALRLRQVLINLIGNAIKFTHRGEVVVRASIRSPRPTRRPNPSTAARAWDWQSQKACWN